MLLERFPRVIHVKLPKLRGKKIGLYTPLPIPHEPRKDLSIDFVLRTPLTARAHDSVMVNWLILFPALQ